MSNEDNNELRIYIGNISPKLAENKLSLETRLSKFGKIVKPLELHTKPIEDYFFGFITLEISNANFEKLKNAFHGILFMGMKLTVGVAKQSFPEAWIQDYRRPDLLKHDRIKRDRIQKARTHRINEANTPYFVNKVDSSIVSTSLNIGANAALGYSKSSHTFNNMSGNTKHTQPTQYLVGMKSYGTETTLKDVACQSYSRLSGKGEVIKGRHRVTKRPHLHFAKGHQTLRILINGELKQIQGYKTKLWGMEKHKTARDLTWRYHNGTWRSGDDHIIEKNITVKIRDPIIGGPQPIECGIDGKKADNYGADIDLDSEEDELKEERNKNSAVLASMFTNYDFDKPLDLSDVDDNGIDEKDIIYDSKGRRKVNRYDYEIQGKQGDDGLDESKYNIDSRKAKELINSFKKTSERPEEEVYYDEDDEGNELDLDALGKQYTTEAINEKYDEDHGFVVVKTSNEYPNGANVEESDQDMEKLIEKAESDAESEAESEAEAEAESEAEAGAEEEEEDDEGEDGKGEDDEGEDDEGEEEEEEEEEEEFIPTFGNKPEPQVNNTDTLRSLFNPNQVSPESQESQFKLALLEDDDDVDDEKVVDISHQKELLDKIKSKQQQEAEEIITSRAKKYGLFWTHSDSPFLQSQSQLNKVSGSKDLVKLPGEADSLLSNADGESPYEQWFWKMRGEFSRECKRRKRDVLRVFKKKSNKNPVV